MIFVKEICSQECVNHSCIEFPLKVLSGSVTLTRYEFVFTKYFEEIFSSPLQKTLFLPPSNIF